MVKKSASKKVKQGVPAVFRETEEGKSMDKDLPFKLLDLEEMSLATWARLGSAGKAPKGAKPYQAEKLEEHKSLKKEIKRNDKIRKKRVK